MDQPSGSDKPGRRRPTLDDVARHAGVSRALVSTALSGAGRVASATRERILQACEEVGYRPNLNARSLASGRSTVVGVLLADLRNSFFGMVADAVARCCDERHLTTLIATGQRTSAGERRAVEQMLSLNPAGLVLLGPTLDDESLRPVLSGTPVVSVSRFLDAASLGSVGLNEVEGVRLVVEHLVGLGHRRVVHIDGGAGVSADERRDGFQAQAQAAGLDARIEPGDFTAEGGYRATGRLIARAREAGEDLPTAVWAGNDVAASGVLVRLREEGLRVPEDVSVVGYDDTVVVSAEQLRLTTVRQPVAEMARVAVSRLTGDDAATDDLRLTPTLVVRGTTAPARADRPLCGVAELPKGRDG